MQNLKPCKMYFFMEKVILCLDFKQGFKLKGQHFFVRRVKRKWYPMAWRFRKNTWCRRLTKLGSSIILVVFSNEKWTRARVERTPVIIMKVSCTLPSVLHGLPCNRRWHSVFLCKNHIQMRRVLILVFLSVQLWLVPCTIIPRLRNWNAKPLTATHLQLLCHLSAGRFTPWVKVLRVV